MPTLDWIFVAVLGISLVVGLWRGLVYEILSVLNWIAAFVLAQWFAPVAAQWLPLTGATEVVRYAAGFVLVFVLSLFAGGLLAFLIRKLVAAVGLRPVDRVLGAAFGLVRGVVILLVVTVVVGMTPQERLAPVTLLPEMATLSMGSVNFGGDVFMNHPADMEVFAQAMREHGVKPELEIFDSGMLSTATRWLKKGLLEGPAHFDLVLGIPGGMAATAEALMYLRAQLPSGSSWTAAGIGAAQLPIGALAIVLGGHVRVGFEDNVYYRKGELASSNAQLVARIARLSRELDRAVATPDEARVLLGIKPRR